MSALIFNLVEYSFSACSSLSIARRVEVTSASNTSLCFRCVSIERAIIFNSSVKKPLSQSNPACPYGITFDKGGGKAYAAWEWPDPMKHGAVR